MKMMNGNLDASRNILRVHMVENFNNNKKLSYLDRRLLKQTLLSYQKNTYYLADIFIARGGGGLDAILTRFSYTVLDTFTEMIFRNRFLSRNITVFSPIHTQLAVPCSSFCSGDVFFADKQYSMEIFDSFS